MTATAGHAVIAPAALADRLDAWCERLVTAARWPALLTIAATPLVAPRALGISLWSFAAVAALAAGPAWIMSRGLEPLVRARFGRLLLLAAGFQVLVWLIVSWIQVARGFVVLGPDGVRYFGSGFQLARQHFGTAGQHPIEYFGTTDLGHYYVFAAVMWLFGDSLPVLQLVNVDCLVLATGLTYLWTAKATPRWALTSGVLTATHLPVVLLATLDLWKDPLVLLAASLAVWGMFGTLGPVDRRHSWYAPGAMAGGLAFLHVTRFYAAAYFEVGMLLVVGSAFVRSRTLVFPARITLTALVTLATAELIPIAAGWPATPTLFRHSVVHTVGTPEMRDYAKGLVERIPLPIKGKVEGGTQIADQHASSEARDALSLKVPPFARRTVVGSVNMVRRLFGPFAWVMPQRWSADMLLTNLYLNYPGMLVWYALLPLIAVGLLTTAWKLRTFDAIDAPLVALAVSLCFYCAQYLSINLAVRQRDIVFPFLMPFAAIAYEQHQGSRAGRRIYAAYWMALVGLAVGHMAVRAFLGSS